MAQLKEIVEAIIMAKPSQYMEVLKYWVWAIMIIGYVNIFSVIITISIDYGVVISIGAVILGTYGIVFFLINPPTEDIISFLIWNFSGLKLVQDWFIRRGC